MTTKKNKQQPEFIPKKSYVKLMSKDHARVIAKNWFKFVGNESTCTHIDDAAYNRKMFKNGLWRYTNPADVSYYFTHEFYIVRMSSGEYSMYLAENFKYAFKRHFKKYEDYTNIYQLQMALDIVERDD